MSYPVLLIHMNVIMDNMKKIVARAGKQGISVWGVTKGISAPVELAHRLSETGITAIADSRILNIIKMKTSGVKIPFVLIRIPMRSELEDVVQYADYSLASDIETINEMSHICERRRQEHKILIAVDVGDLREGFMLNEAEIVAKKMRKISPFLKIAGVAVNFACASGVLPSVESLNSFIKFGETIESELSCKLEVFSGGASTVSLTELENNFFPQRVNNLRIGQGYLLGKTTIPDFNIPWLCQNTMEIKAELVEIRKKPTLPIGKIALSSSREIPVFEDRGERLRGILAIGTQDVTVSKLLPLDENVKIITASSDHMIVDLEDCLVSYRTGDILTFRPNYHAMLSASTSVYVTKIFVD